MKKIFALSILFLMVAYSSDAQPVQGVAAFVKSGYYSLSSAASLNKITPAGYGSRSNNFFTLGAECYYRNNKMILTVDGNIGVQNGKSIYDKGIKFSTGTGYAKFGWIIIEQSHYWIYPNIGAGIAAIAMNTYDKKSDNARDIQTHINNNASMDLGLNTDIVLKRNPAQDGFSSLISGIRAGYRFSIKNKTWRDFYGNKINNIPAYTQKGFYVTATIGCGAFIKGKIFLKAE